MPIYDKPTKTLMSEWAAKALRPGQVFSKDAPVRWFAENYPKIKRSTVTAHVEGMCINNRVRRHHPNIRPGSGYDLFFKLGTDRFRLWSHDTDPAPVYKPEIEKELSEAADAENSDPDAEIEAEAAREFAFERDLRNYLVKNLHLIEPGLRVYDEDDISGVEFPVGGRFIDVLAVDRHGAYVVIELKVSRGYDRVVGQLLRYMAWVEKNIEGAKSVRGVIVAKEISEDLRLAASRIPDVKLIEYEISFKLRPL